MVIFAIYAIVLAFFWIKTLISTTSSNNEQEVNNFLTLKHMKIRRYKLYGLLYIITLFYLVSISMISARFMPEEKKSFSSVGEQLNHAWQIMLNFPWWLQLLFFIALIFFIGMFALPLINCVKNKLKGI
ncbi:hypothetical protein [Fastidiosibacter lacustris]|uniref:hypothetical protein n=1 Tax=Fastidiosibacter lacustris TaxID=2056695 RepID=UPI000E34ECDC|nr:hypothetical protein [Fastidiosibacter lacustris]